MDETKHKVLTEHKKVCWHKKRRLSSEESLEFSESTVDELQSELRSCKARMSELEASLDDAICQLEGKAMLQAKCSGIFKDNVRVCCLQLLSLNVGLLNVRPVIECVLEMVGMHIDELPSTGALSNMLIELKRITSLHAAKELLASDNLTVHSDGTSKFGDKFGSFQLATESKAFSMGVVDMKCGTAAHTLEKLQEILADVTDVC